MNRRRLLKGLMVAGGAATTAVVAKPAKAAVKRRREPAPDAVGMLYDSTRCIGCKACVVACREANGLPPTRSAVDGQLHDMQDELNATTKTVLKLYRSEEDPSVFAFMKQQCMHCIDPACVSACMIGAFHKEQGGLVAWDADRCVGCRYCQIACPFGVPRFEWAKNDPKIVKCELCKDRLAKGQQPACTEVCPRGAVVFGKLVELKAEAHRRIDANPALYQAKVYGEEEAGGTQVLYLSNAKVPFEKLGLPKLDSTSLPYRTESLQHAIYQGFATPAVLYAGLAVAVVRNWRGARPPEEGGEEKKEDPS